MTRFEPILNRAIERKGGLAALKALLPSVKTQQSLVDIPADRYLAEMTRRVFQAGFVWKVVDHKWNGFEEVFSGFHPLYHAQTSDEQVEAFAKDERVIRNLQKVATVRANAQFILDIESEHGSFGAFIAHWPPEQIVDLWLLMKKRGSRLGGVTGSVFLRTMGKETFMLSRDVGICLQNHKVIDKPNPTSQRDLKTIQETFNEWHEETGYNLAELSRIASCAVD